jgi:hypothetical protein
MFKRILLTLDPTPAGVSAKRHALGLAARNGACVSGLVIIDPNVITPPEPTPMGADAFKQHKDSFFLEKAQINAKSTIDQFNTDRSLARVDGEAKIVVGPALKRLVEESDLCDLIVSGIDLACDSATSRGVSPVIEGLLRDNSRPVLATRCSDRDLSRRTVVAYDGSIPSMRAIQLFCCSRINIEQEVVVTTVDSDKASAERMARRAAQYMREHGPFAHQMILLPRCSKLRKKFSPV